MQDVFREQLSEEELEQYDLFDSRAALFSSFVVWPGIAGLVSYAADKAHLALVCLVIVLCAVPLMLFFARRARRVREMAEKRYLEKVEADEAAKRAG